MNIVDFNNNYDYTTLLLNNNISNNKLNKYIDVNEHKKRRRAVRSPSDFLHCSHYVAQLNHAALPSNFLHNDEANNIYIDDLKTRIIIINYKYINIYSFDVINIINEWDFLFSLYSPVSICYNDDCFLSKNDYIDNKRYLIRLFILMDTSYNCFIYALYILKKYNNKHYIINLHNINKLLFISLVLSIKLLDDKHFNNKIFCDIGCMSLSELNKLEFIFLKKINYKIFNKKLFNKIILIKSS